MSIITETASFFTKSSNKQGFKLLRPLSKGTKLLSFSVIKVIIIITPSPDLDAQHNINNTYYLCLCLCACMYPCADCLVGGQFVFTNHQIVVLPSESTHTVVASAIRLEPC